MNNVIDIAKSPLTDALESACNTVSVASVCGSLAETLNTVETIKPKSFGIEDSLSKTLDSFGEVNSLPSYKVTCNLHSVNSAKILYY